MNDTLSALLIVAVVAAVTLFTRVLPFAVFRDRKLPRMVSYLGRVLPAAIMAILIVYCLRGVSFGAYPYGLPEAIAAAVVIALHLWKRSVLLSIFSGTAVYMLMIQVIF